MTVTVEIKSKPSSPTVWLEVTYSGLAPPVWLFDDLAMVGWKPPAIPPPPASAIDWSRPDAATGQNFTITDYLVEGAVVEAPRGSGPLGRWTDADRRAHFAVLEGVLERHDLLDQAKDGKRAARTKPPAAAAPTAVAPAPSAVLPAGSVRLNATIARTSEAAIATALANAGVTALTFAPVLRTIVHMYRGAKTEQQVIDHLRLEALTTTDAAEDVQAAITRAAVATGQPAPDIAIEVSLPPDAPVPVDGPPPQLHALKAVRSA